MEIFMTILVTFSTILTPATPQIAQDPSIVIIGAGISGLAAADKLINQYKFKNVIILEALNRVGGRIYPVKSGNTTIQMGAQWIHNRHNPIFDMALQLGLLPSGNVKPDEDTDQSLYLDQSGCPLSDRLADAFGTFTDNTFKQMEDWDFQKHPNMRGKSYGEIVDQLYGQFLAKKKYNASDVKIMDAMEKNFKSGIEQYYAAEDWNMISLRPATGDDVDEDEDDNDHDDEGPISISMGQPGYKAILDEMTRRVPPQKYIQFNSTVQRIRWSGTSNGKVQIDLVNGQSVNADHVIVTSSLGHLKRFGQNLFVPTLPQKKLDTINALGFGTVDKLFLIFDKTYWPNKITELNFIRVNGSGSRSCSLNQNFAETDLTRMFENGVPRSSPPSILFWIGGRFPATFENIPDSKILDAATTVVRKYFNNPSIPAPRIMRSAWYSDPLFLGSYSYDSMTCEKIKCNRTTLMEPLYAMRNGNTIPVVLFAGEATNPTHYSMVHGAFDSGLREADRLGKLYPK